MLQKPEFLKSIFYRSVSGCTDGKEAGLSPPAHPASPAQAPAARHQPPLRHTAHGAPQGDDNNSIVAIMIMIVIMIIIVIMIVIMIMIIIMIVIVIVIRKNPGRVNFQLTSMYLLIMPVYLI